MAHGPGNGRFDIHEQIGSGGFGTVHRATDDVLGRTVALKRVQVPPGLSATGTADRFAGWLRHLTGL